VSDVRVIISDFGGVLTNPLEEAFREWEESSRIPLEELGKAMMVVGEQIGENPLYRLERGEMAMADFEQAIETELRRQINDYAEFVGFTDFYFTQLFPNEPFIDFLREYKTGGGRLALLTNNVREWEPHWRAMLPVDELFETVVDSGFVGTRKPEREIYEITHERIVALPGLAGVTPAECVLVDDIEHNCVAAEEFGFRAVRYQGEVDDVLAELRPLLAR
jgi:epoxide hydrolase-like predicted phosphatase